MTRLQPGETLRILLVSQSEELRDEVVVVLNNYAGEHSLHWVAQAELAARRAQDLLPHTVLLDGAFGPSEITRTIKQIIADAPGVPILVLVDEKGLGIARQAVLTGARGFVTKPVVADELWGTIHQLLSGPTHGAHESNRSASSGRIVVFVGPKGGTGRTTVAVNTALALIKDMGQRVVMVDADFAAPALDVVLNLRDDSDITHLLARSSRLDGELILGVLSEHSSGLRVLLAPPPGQLSTPTLPQVQQILGHLRQMFDWVIVDLGLPLDEMAFAFADSADRIIMTVQPEMVGLRNSRLMIDQFHARGHSEDGLWLVLNRSTLPSGISRHDIEARLRVRVHETVPDDQPLVSMSVNRGVPLMMTDDRSAVARSIRRIASQLVQELGAKAGVHSALVESSTVRRNPLERWLHRPGKVQSLGKQAK